MEKIRTIPMSTEEIQEIFLDNSLHYNIDLKNSTLKGEAFLTYIANMQINCSLMAIEDTPTEEKFEILKYYLAFKQTIRCETLHRAIAMILLKYVKAPLQHHVEWISEEEINLFLSENRELLVVPSLFISSASLFVPSFNKEFKKNIFVPACESGEIEVIDDVDIVGINLINIFSIPDFTETFITYHDLITTPEEKKLLYYKAQVERLQYNNKTLYQIFTELKEDSFLMSFSHLLLYHNKDQRDVKILKELMSNDTPL